MQILDRYIARSIAMSSLVVMSVLLALFTFFAFTDEVDKIGQGQYDAPAAVQYVVMTMPRLMYQLFPIVALLGSIIGLGLLAGSSELTVMRAAGVSLGRIVWSVMKVGLLFVLLALAIGEGIAPGAERQAQAMRSVAMSDRLELGGRSGLWARDGNSVVNVREILPGERLGNIYIYELDDANRLMRVVHAESAAYRNGRWLLEQVESSRISPVRVTSSRVPSEPWDTRLSPDLLGVVTVKPNTLSILGLYQYVGYLHDNGLEAATYEQALWAKLTAPFITGVMVFIAIPFVFGPLRSVGIGHRVLVGALLGIGFHLLNQMFAYLGLVFHLTPALTALLPAAAALIVAVGFLSRVR